MAQEKGQFQKQQQAEGGAKNTYSTMMYNGWLEKHEEISASSPKYVLEDCTSPKVQPLPSNAK